MPTAARVLVLCGPSGSGKSRWAAQLSSQHGWPIVRLDDFYKPVDDPTLPRFSDGSVDWDDVGSWHQEAALEALASLCRTGCAATPVYDISTSSIVGSGEVRLAGSEVVIAEGIFAAHTIAPLQELGLLEGAYCVHHNRWVTFARRLLRDLRERRKPPMVLLRRGLRLTFAEPAIVAQQCELGAIAIRPKALERQLAG